MMPFYPDFLLMMVFQLFLSWLTQAVPDLNNFLYKDFLNGNVHFEGVKLYVDATQSTVSAARGGNATLKCRYWYEPELRSSRRVRIKWSWLPATGGPKTDVLVAIGSRNRTFGDFRGRVHLRQDSPGDATLIMTELQLNDTGRYRCEVVDGLEDKSVVVDLELRGVVFPYQPPLGRYHLSFPAAQQACKEQDSTLATFEQLFQSWKEGLNWCNAGWLADGSVQYPITQPRVPCGGHGLAPGLRSYEIRHRHLHRYEIRHRHLHRYDAFCFSSSLRGKVYYLQHPLKLNLTKAREACQEVGAEIANVGQLFAAWKIMGLDRCDAGWLADRSLRYPITRPRRSCGLSEPGVRNFGFPPPQQKHGVYCYKSMND